MGPATPRAGCSSVPTWSSPPLMSSRAQRRSPSESEVRSAGISEATVVGIDRATDLALVRTARPLGGHIFRLATAEPRDGDSVALVGYPVGDPLLSVRYGQIGDDGRTEEFTGGPVVASDGSVAGVVSGVSISPRPRRSAGRCRSVLTWRGRRVGRRCQRRSRRRAARPRRIRARYPRSLSRCGTGIRRQGSPRRASRSMPARPTTADTRPRTPCRVHGCYGRTPPAGHLALREPPGAGSRSWTSVTPVAGWRWRSGCAPNGRPGRVPADRPARSGDWTSRWCPRTASGASTR